MNTSISIIPALTRPHFAIRVYAVGLGLLAALTVLIGTSQYGPGVTPDSVNYLSAGENLFAGKGLFTFEGVPLVHWPPAYSVLLGLLRIVGFAPDVGTILLNSLLYGAIVAASVMWLSGMVRTPTIFYLGGIALTSCTSVYGISLYMWSELPFIALTLSALWLVGHYAQHGSRRVLIMAAVLVGGACMVRYAGLFTLAAIGIVVFFRAAAVRQRRSLIDLVLFMLIAGLPITLWMARNYAVSGTVAGWRGEALFPLEYNVSRLLDVILGWVMPMDILNGLPFGVKLLCVAPFGLAVIGMAVYPFWAGRVRLFPAAVLALYVVIYIAQVFITSTTTAINAIDARLCAPFALPMILVVLVSADGLMNCLRRYRWVWSLAVAFTVCLMGVDLSNQVRTELSVGRLSFNQPYYAETQITLTLRAVSLPGLLLSNRPEALYYLTGQSAFHWPRRMILVGPHAPYEDFDTFYAEASRPEGDPIFLVQYRAAEREGSVYTLAELLAYFPKATPLLHFPDGAVWRLR